MHPGLGCGWGGGGVGCSQVPQLTWSGNLTRSGGPLGLVGLWVCWWGRGSDGVMGQVDLVVC